MQNLRYDFFLYILINDSHFYFGQEFHFSFLVFLIDDKGS